MFHAVAEMASTNPRVLQSTADDDSDNSDFSSSSVVENRVSLDRRPRDGGTVDRVDVSINSQLSRLSSPGECGKYCDPAEVN